ncbi:helitron helicase-like protein [Marssonina coronariae]|uniref:Helitron helicase-like protein n=1 Tax=Diplocarpon coronariae TaxID=2795749 RepID=A0A218YX22_9HELO|nr:helitron helicase-like protein [Marssonina coronariae]
MDLQDSSGLDSKNKSRWLQVALQNAWIALACDVWPARCNRQDIPDVTCNLLWHESEKECLLVVVVDGSAPSTLPCCHAGPAECRGAKRERGFARRALSGFGRVGSEGVRASEDPRNSSSSTRLDEHLERRHFFAIPRASLPAVTIYQGTPPHVQRWFAFSRTAVESQSGSHFLHISGHGKSGQVAAGSYYEPRRVRA